MTPGIFRVTLGNWMLAKKALEMDGRRIDGLDRDLNISEMQPKLTVDQVFDLIRRKLESRERGDNYLRQGGHQSRDRFRTPTRDSPRYVRETSAESQKNSEGQKSPTSPRQVTPRGRNRDRRRSQERRNSYSPGPKGRDATPTSPASQPSSEKSQNGKGFGKGKGKGKGKGGWNSPLWNTPQRDGNFGNYSNGRWQSPTQNRNNQQGGVVEWTNNLEQ